VCISDTAGIRLHSPDPIEIEGIERAHRRFLLSFFLSFFSQLIFNNLPLPHPTLLFSAGINYIRTELGIDLGSLVRDPTDHPIEDIQTLDLHCLGLESLSSNIGCPLVYATLGNQGLILKSIFSKFRALCRLD